MHLLSYPLADDFLEEKDSYSWLILTAFGWAGLQWSAQCVDPEMLSGGQSMLIQSAPKITCHPPPLAGSCPLRSHTAGYLCAVSCFITMVFGCTPLFSHPLPGDLVVPWSSRRVLGHASAGAAGQGGLSLVEIRLGFGLKRAGGGSWAGGSAPLPSTASVAHLPLSPADRGCPGCQPHDEAHTAPAQV